MSEPSEEPNPAEGAEGIPPAAPPFELEPAPSLESAPPLELPGPPGAAPTQQPSPSTTPPRRGFFTLRRPPPTPPKLRVALTLQPAELRKLWMESEWDAIVKQYQEQFVETLRLTAAKTLGEEVQKKQKTELTGSKKTRGGAQSEDWNRVMDAIRLRGES